MLTIHDSFSFEANDFEITACGEVLVDLISKEEAPLKSCFDFSRHFGGSPANVLVNMQRLKNRTALIARIAKDQFGQYLSEILENEAVNLDCLQFDSQARTPVVFVNKSKKTPSWLAYRGAETKLKFKKQIYDKIFNSSIFFTGSFILSQKPAQTTVLQALDYAVEQNKLIAFDPNFRPQLWTNTQEAKQIIKKVIAKADLIKPSLDDAYYLYGQQSPHNYLKKYHNDGAKIVVLSLGKNGILLSDSKTSPLEIPSFAEKVVDVTGAGDSFWAGFLTGILKGFSLTKAAQIGNAVAAFKIQGLGALSSVPPLREIMNHYDL